MKYMKPEVTLMDAATAAIQGQLPGSKVGNQSDNVQDITAAAYEADE